MKLLIIKPKLKNWALSRAIGEGKDENKVFIAYYFKYLLNYPLLIRRGWYLSKFISRILYLYDYLSRFDVAIGLMRATFHKSFTMNHETFGLLLHPGKYLAVSVLKLLLGFTPSFDGALLAFRLKASLLATLALPRTGVTRYLFTEYIISYVLSECSDFPLFI